MIHFALVIFALYVMYRLTVFLFVLYASLGIFGRIVLTFMLLIIFFFAVL